MSNGKVLRYFLIYAIIAACMVVGFVGCTIQGKAANRDIDTKIDRAEVSADAQTMGDRLTEVLQKMDQRGINHGHTRPFYQTDWTDVGKDYEAIKNLRDRCYELAKLDHASTAYQTGLTDIRGTIHTIDVGAADYVQWHNGWWYIFLGLLGVGAVVAIFNCVDYFRGD